MHLGVVAPDAYGGAGGVVGGLAPFGGGPDGCVDPAAELGGGAGSGSRPRPSMVR